MQRAAVGEVSYNEFDKPTVMRNKPEGRDSRFGAAAGKEASLELLDIPAFLRRQAD